jgi:hypothetical protein
MTIPRKHRVWVLENGNVERRFFPETEKTKRIG